MQQGWGQRRAAGRAKLRTAPSSPSTLRASLCTVDLCVPSLEAPQTPSPGEIPVPAAQPCRPRSPIPIAFQIPAASHLFRSKGLLRSLASEPCG